jgi:hypothetical protein
MNYDRLVGTGWRPYRICTWFIAWFALIAATATVLGMNGWPWRFSDLHPYLLRNAGDNWLDNAFSIYRINDADSQKLTKIVYVGGSVCLESLPSDSRMSNELAKRLEQAVQFTSICSPYQNFADEARIVDALGTLPGLVILGTEPAFFAKVAERQFEARADAQKAGGYGYFYLPIQAQLRGVARRQGVEVGVFTDILAFWKTGPRAITDAAKRALRNGPVEFRRHKINAYRVLDYEAIAARFIANYRKSAHMNDAFRRQTIRSALDNGNRVVLVEIPNDENLIGLFDPVREDYQARVSNMVRDFAIRHLVAQTRTSWTKPDFFDMHHLSPRGREKFASVLADLLTTEIRPN